MRKKIVLLLASAVLTAAVACGEKSEISLTETSYDESGRPVVTIGMFGSGPLPDLGDHLSAPTDIAVEYVNYAKDVGEDYDGEKAFMQAKQAILSGDPPDIIALSPEFMLRLYKLGALADLYELMEEYDGLKPDEFLPNVLEGFELNGELPAMAEAYTIRTYFAKTKFVGKEYENWTPEEAMSFYESMPEGMSFMEENGGEATLMDYMLNMSYTDYASPFSDTCDFRGGGFTKILDFCVDNPFETGRFGSILDMSESELSVYVKEQSLAGVNDKYLIYPIDIWGFNIHIATNTYFYTGGDDVTFVGYPTENGQGTRIMPSTELYAISRQSGNKENAWKILSYILKKRPIKANDKAAIYGLPILKSQLEADYDDREDYYHSINSGSFFSGDAIEEENRSYLPKEYKDKLLDYIENVKIDIYSPSQVKYIIDEEAQAVLAGERSPEDCAEILDDRVSIYLSEKS